MIKPIRFENRINADFHTILRQRIDSYFTENSLSKHGNAFMAFKVAFFLGGTIAAYLLMLFAPISLPVSYLCWAMLGFFAAFDGVNICHDAIHGALSKNPRINKALGLVFNVLGANAYVWSISHNIQHHTFTNIEQHDDDLGSVPILRMSPHQRLRKIHKHQFWYAFLFYGLASLSWVFIKDYKKMLGPKIGSYVRKHPKIEYFNLFFFKAIYYTLFLVLPMIILPFAWWQVLCGFLIMHFCEGITLAIIFMLAHIVDEAEFPLPDKDSGKMENAWAVHQMVTTANFARKSWLVSFFSGGLNFQVEHHLFPLICHVHYPRISEIVKRTAEENNIPYNDSPTMFQALISHIKFLKRMGQKPVKLQAV